MCTLTCPNVRAVQRAVEQSEGEDFAEEIVLFLHKEIPQDHTDTNQKLKRNTTQQCVKKWSQCEWLNNKKPRFKAIQVKHMLSQKL